MRPIPFPYFARYATRPRYASGTNDFGYGALSQRTGRIRPPVRALFLANFRFAATLRQSYTIYHFFRFASFYGLFCGLSGRASAFPLWLFDFRGFSCDSGRFLFDWMVAPKERSGSGPVKPLAFAATWRINFASFTKRATAAHQRKNLCWHIISCKLLFRQIRTYENQMYNTFHSAMVFRVQLYVFRGPGPTVSIRP